MMNRGRQLSTLLLLAGLMAGGCASTIQDRGRGMPSAGQSDVVLKIRMGDRKGDPIVRVRLEDYVYGVVMGESWVPNEKPAVKYEMLKLQALLARTYAVSNLRRHAKEEGFHLCSTTHCQLYRPTKTNTPVARLAWSATNDTAGRFIVDKTSHMPIQTLFHASCGGHTSGAETVWGGAWASNLRPVKDSFCTLEAHSEWRFEIDRTRLSSALNRNRATKVGGRVKSVSVIRRDAGGRAQVIRIEGDRTVDVRGEDLRTALTRAFGVRTLKSTRLAVTRRGDMFRFDGAGFGHGVGLCQAGALVQARNGRRADEIVRYYYAQAQIEAGRLRLAN